MASDAILRLSERQRQCLRLTLVRRSSKEIARELGISAHMVDKYIKTAREMLGVTSRFEAARLLADHEGVDWVQKLDPQRLDLSLPILAPPSPAPRSGEASGAGTQGVPLPFPTAGRPRNDLTAGQRLAWITAIAAFSAVLAAGLMSGSITLLQAIGSLLPR